VKTLLYLVVLACFIPLRINAQTRVVHHDNGSVKAEITKIKSGMVRVERFTPQGQLYETGYYRYNRRHGHWQSFNDAGEVVTSAYFYDDKKEGVWTINDPYSGVKHIVYFNNNRLLRMETESLVLMYK
jgi:antitoxin component YwqK of YwqJK toxin-antitoxin module